MKAVRVEIVRFLDPAQPGSVECRLWDAAGREWTFIEKVPVVSDEPLDANSEYPRAGVVACDVLEARRDDLGREVRTIDTSHPWGVEAEGGATRFEVTAEQLTEI
jgi:hypothetical protein